MTKRLTAYKTIDMKPAQGPLRSPASMCFMIHAAKN
jgi:hypothetical protein